MKNWIKKQFTWPWTNLIIYIFVTFWIVDGVSKMYQGFTLEEVGWIIAGMWEMLFGFLYGTWTSWMRSKNEFIKQLFTMISEQQGLLDQILKLSDEAKKLRDEQNQSTNKI